MTSRCRLLAFLLHHAAQRAHDTAQRRNATFPLVGDAWNRLDQQLKRDKQRVYRLIAAGDEAWAATHRA